jgi:hypothetical protein
MMDVDRDNLKYLKTYQFMDDPELVPPRQTQDNEDKPFLLRVSADNNTAVP